MGLFRNQRKIDKNAKDHPGGKRIKTPQKFSFEFFQNVISRWNKSKTVNRILKFLTLTKSKQNFVKKKNKEFHFNEFRFFI